MPRRSSALVLTAALVLASAASARASAVTEVSLTPSTWAGGATATWAMRFRTTTSTGDHGTVDVDAPAGTVFSADPADYQVQPFLRAGREAPTTVTVTSGGRHVRIGALLVGNWPTSVVIRNVHNPPQGADGGQVTLSTNTDTGPVPASGPGGPDTSQLGRGFADGLFTQPASVGRVTMVASRRQTGAIATWTYRFSPHTALGPGQTITLFGHSTTLFPPLGTLYTVNGTKV